MQICLMPAGGSLMDGEGCSSTNRLARAGESLQSWKSRA
jgi:hypothetical protein